MKTRIGILGLGGVGGFIGGLLAEKYSTSHNKPEDEIEVIFICRPATAKIINEKGLRLMIDHEEKIIHPDLVSSDPDNIGHLDLLICATKSYDLEEGLRTLGSCIHSKTIVMPLLNGVDAVERIREMHPGAEVAEACIYIVSRVLEPAVVIVTGFKHSLYFGSDNISRERLEKLQQIFQGAGINSFLSDDIRQTVWEKFLFISPIASLTSYLDQPMGQILDNLESKVILTQLLQEFLEVAKAHGIKLDNDIFEKTLSKMEKLPYETTSSMHNDFKKGGRTEYLSLTDYVVNLGDQLRLETKTYDYILEGLRKRSAI